MSTLDFIHSLRRLNIYLSVEGDRLCCNAPKGAVSEALGAEISEHKAEIVAFLKRHRSLAPEKIQQVSRGEKAFPLSFAQQRLWFLDQLETQSATYNISVALRLSGPLDPLALEAAFNEIVQRHEILRTTFACENDEPMQVIHSDQRLSLTQVDLRTYPAAAQEAEVQHRVNLAANKPFDLAKENAIRADLFRLADDAYVLLVVMHHIVSDGWSIDIFVREWSLLYRDFSQGRLPTLPALPIQYADFAHWQRQWLSGEVLAQQLGYWTQQLAGLPPVLALPIDRPRPNRQSYQGDRLTMVLSSALSGSLKALSRQTDTTLYMLLLAIFKLLLFRQTGEADIAVGTTIANRNRHDIENLIGFFVNTLVIRTDLAGEPTFLDLLARVKQTSLAAYEHQDLPFDKLVEALNPERHLSHHPIVQVVFSMQNQSQSALVLDGVKVEPFEIKREVAKFDLGLNVVEQTAEQGDRIEVHFAYSTDLFDVSTIEHMAQQFEALSSAVVAAPDRVITTFSRTQSSEGRFSCVLVGKGSLLIPCAQQLLKDGHYLCGVVSPEKRVQDWAAGHSIAYFSTVAALAETVENASFDYLFGVINLEILSPELLSLPAKAAINLHDALLPRYAGLHAASWAIYHQAPAHGITWHMMTADIDAGDIIKQCSVPITSTDTVFTLSAKCHELALESFAELVEDLREDRIVLRSQDLSARTYFNAVDRPTPGCVVNWQQPAAAILALVRSLNFGPYDNSFGLPKLYGKSGFVLMTQLEISGSLTDLPPGVVVKIESTGFQISTASQDVVVRSLQTLEGEPIDIVDWARQNNLQVGAPLASVPESLSQSIASIEAACLRQENFWRRKLADMAPAYLPIPEQRQVALRATASHHDSVNNTGNNTGDRSRREQNSSGYSASERVFWQLPSSALERFDSTVPGRNRQEKLLTLFVSYLARVTSSTVQKNSLSLGLSVPETVLKGAASALFAGVVPFDVAIDPHCSLATAVGQIQQQLTQVHKAQTFHRDIVTRYQQLGVLQTLPIEQQFGIILSLSSSVVDDMPLNDTPLGEPPPEWRAAVEWRIDKAGACVCAYDPSRYRTQDIERFLQSFSVFVEQWTLAPATQLAVVPLLSASDVSDLEQWQQPISEVSPPDVMAVFESQVAQRPAALALLDGRTQQQLTYRALNKRVNQLANYLRQCGLTPEGLVGICVDRSVEMVVSMLAVLKAGGAYVPLDPQYPVARLAWMMSDSQVSLLLTEESKLEMFAGFAARKICLDSERDRITECDTHNLSVAENIDAATALERTANSLAYVIYTSGSTGKPKGAMLQRDALANFVQAAIVDYGITAADRVLQFGSISFDIAVEEIYPCLNAGGTLVLRTDEAISSATRFLDCCDMWQISVLTLPTAYWQQVMVDVAENTLPLPKSLRLFIIGGERVSPEVVKLWQQLCPTLPLINGYGPTETTVAATTFHLEETTSLRGEVPIGRALSNVQTYVLDEHLQRMPVGIAGELHIGGIGLARGYLNQPALSAARFIPNPFSANPLIQDSQARLYKTGDLVRYLPDGNLEFLGRIDDQVKIRGLRIELGEIEAALAEHPAVQFAVASVRFDDTGAAMQLAAHFVAAQRAGSNLPRTADLRAFLSASLPDYMVPTTFSAIAAFPLTPSGKIDRRALSTLEPVVSASAPVSVVAPRNDIEQKLAAIWRSLLKREDIGIYDNFFALGGHSLLAMQVVSRIQRQFSVDVSLRSLFEATTIADLADVVKTHLTQSNRPQAAVKTAVIPRSSRRRSSV